MPSRLYRTHWRTADSEQLRAASLADGRAEDPYRPYEEERALITEWRSKLAQPPASIVSRWAFHPDERVRAELVYSSRTHFWIDHTSKPSESIPRRDWEKMFLDRIVADLHAERVYWTPLLDAWVCTDRLASRPAVENVMKILAPWLQTQSTSDDVRQMLHSFEASDIHIAILKHAGCIDQKLAREIYKQTTNPYRIALLADNPTISTDVMSALVEWFVEDWEARIRGAPAIRNDSHVCLSELMKKRPSFIPPNVLRRIYALPQLAHDLGVRTIDYGRYLYKLENQEGAKLPEVALYELTFFSERIASNRLPVPSDVLCAAVPFIRHRKRLLLDLLIKHPNTDITVWRKALYYTQAGEICEFAARHPDLYQDPEVCKYLLRSRNSKVHSLLIRNADSQTAAQTVRRLIARGQLKSVAEALAARAPGKPIALEPADLVPLLRSDNPKIRLAAITCLNRLQPSTQPVTTLPKPPRPADAPRRKR